MILDLVTETWKTCKVKFVLKQDQLRTTVPECATKLKQSLTLMLFLKLCFSFHYYFFFFTVFFETHACMNIYLLRFDVQIFRFTWCGKTNLQCSENKKLCIIQHLGQTRSSAIEHHTQARFRCAQNMHAHRSGDMHALAAHFIWFALITF